MDYSKLSDFEINKRVADIVMNGTWHIRPSHPDNNTGGWLYGSNGVQTYDLPDYCNNPADAWPIIHQHGISIAFDKDEDEWIAWGDFAFDQAGWDMKKEPQISCPHINPLRATMIVFLMMQEEKMNAHG